MELNLYLPLRASRSIEILSKCCPKLRLIFLCFHWPVVSFLYCELCLNRKTLSPANSCHPLTLSRQARICNVKAQLWIEFAVDSKIVGNFGSLYCIICISLGHIDATKF